MRQTRELTSIEERIVRLMKLKESANDEGCAVSAFAIIHELFGLYAFDADGKAAVAKLRKEASKLEKIIFSPADLRRLHGKPRKTPGKRRR